MGKRRFKTKQELEGVTHLYGLPYGEPVDNNPQARTIYVLDVNTTKDPHPYAGRDFIVLTPTLKESHRAQKKLFRLGYVWSSRNEQKLRDYITNIVTSGRKLLHNPLPEDYDELMVLTVDQLMEGHVPTEFEKTAARIAKYYTGGVDPYSKGPSKAKKPDAYISPDDGFIYLWNDEKNKEVLGPHVSGAHRFNLMSEADFKAKHQKPPKLMFGIWEVKTEHNLIHVGCETFFRSDLEVFAKIHKHVRSHKLIPEEAYNFLVKNKKELDLDF